MIFWLESQSTEIIALIVFGLIYLAAAITFLVVVQASRASVKEELRTVTPGVLSPLGAILGIMIAFLAARVWANVDRGRVCDTGNQRAAPSGAHRQVVAAGRPRPISGRDQGASQVYCF